MIGMLAGIGRLAIVICACFTIFSSTVAGYIYGHARDVMSFGNFSVPAGTALTPQELAYGLIGFVVGFGIAGAIFGAIAALFDIRDDLKTLVERGEGFTRASVGSEDPDQDRREPRLA